MAIFYVNDVIANTAGNIKNCYTIVMKPAISIKNVTKKFGNKYALNDVTLTINKGEIFGFLGPNGAGKTTTIRCLMDYYSVTSGSVRILGKDARQHSAELKNQIGYLSSDVQLYQNWTSREHIDFVAGIKGRGRADELVALFQLDTAKKVRNLSSGNKQKLAIILAFMGSPSVLIMDEPTRGLDPLLQNQLYDLLHAYAKAGGTVFLSSHNLAEVQHLCDSVAVIKDGKIIAADTMNDILQKRLHTIQAVSTHAFNHADFTGDTIEIVAGTGKSITLRVRGSINTVLAKLARYTLTDLEITHSSLEDIFMEYY